MCIFQRSYAKRRLANFLLDREAGTKKKTCYTLGYSQALLSLQRAESLKRPTAIKNP